MRQLIAAGLMLIAAGCGTTGHEPASYAPQSGVDTSAQTRARIHTELAAGYYELGNYGVSLQEAAEALKSDSNYAPALNVLGLVYMELRDDKAAETSFQRALRVSPLDSDTNNNYGWFLCQRKREQESIKYFLAALRNPLYTTPDKSWVNAGLCARQAGDLNTAEEYFQKALKVRPTQPQALFHMADMAYQRKNYPEAKVYLARLLRDIEPTAATLWLALRVERGLGDRDAEASLGFQLRKNFPDSREARALIAGRYE
ncbi:MAG: type IV pilus biogenesis/stability protein PilW [Betaproteobacteria bacterium]|nr:type IV pilus biogenesis/stability protein PilW [Betaproteobacteria bacterium]